MLLVIFNRPDSTRRVFETIRSARPRRLFIAADGPRSGHPDDAETVPKARSIGAGVDWDCDVRVLFRDQNIGCARNISSAINWAFQSADELIILEDDCVPASSFFPFCTQLLERYRDDERVFVISGNNFHPGPPRTPYSYYFSRFNHCWGWATWRRAWSHFDLDMALWPEIKKGMWLLDVLGDPLAVGYWQRIFDSTAAGDIDTWDYQWTLACWVQSGLTILPSKNLVENIGFGRDATHTKKAPPVIATAAEMDFPLVHPPFIIRDERADSWIQRNNFGDTARWKCLSMWRRLLRSWRF